MTPKQLERDGWSKCPAVVVSPATAALPTLKQASLEAETAYRDAVYIAHLEGASFAELSDALGVTRQAVRQMTVRAGVAEKQMRERLAEIDAWYERAIEKMMDRPGDFKRVTAFQNARAKKLGVRNGLLDRSSTLSR